MSANAATRAPSFPPQQATAEPVAPQKAKGRSPLQQLLHALNQPLTGLQCSMEVALAAPRTVEQYVRGLREGLELTERMRALVGAIREVTDMEETNADRNLEDYSVTELGEVLQRTIDDFAPVSEVKSVRVEFASNAAGISAPLSDTANRRMLETAVFRLFESALGSAALGSALCIEVGGQVGESKTAVWMRARWHAGSPPSVAWRSEIGLLVSQAGFDNLGASWERLRDGEMETVTIRLKGTPSELNRP
jgi:hypothetical protein